MRTIERRFNKIKKENDYWSDYICLAEAVRGQKFTHRSLYRYFKKLVPPEDYNKADTKKLVGFLYKVSKTPEECTFSGKIAPQMAKSIKYDLGLINPTLTPFLLDKEQVLL
jgi:hypothetical protein